MIPEFNHSHVLPPFVGQSHTSATASPYPVTASKLVERFGTSAERIVLLDGLFRYRAALAGLGFVNGFQWLDGSFVENVELFEGRSPRDMDVVSFVEPPVNMSTSEIATLLRQHPSLFDRSRCRAEFRCDTFLVRLNVDAHRLVRETTFWHGLFSHRRGDQVWKGMLQLPLSSDDGDARMQLSHMNPGACRVATT